MEKLTVEVAATASHVLASFIAVVPSKVVVVVIVTSACARSAI